MYSRKAVVLSARNRNTDRAFLRPVFFYVRAKKRKDSRGAGIFYGKIKIHSGNGTKSLDVNKKDNI